MPTKYEDALAKIEKAIDEINLVENGASRALYAVKKGNSAKAELEVNSVENGASRALYAAKAAREAMLASGAPSAFARFVNPFIVTPKIVIPDVVIQPGDRTATVCIRLEKACRLQIEVGVGVANGVGAYAGGHYIPVSKRVIFRPGETEKFFDVQILRDLGLGNSIKIFSGGSSNSPPVPGATGNIIQGEARTVFVPSPQPVYPAAKKKSGRAMVFDSQFLEPVTPTATAGAWRSRFGWGRVQGANGEIAPYAHKDTDPGVDPHPIVDGKRVLRCEFAPVFANGAVPDANSKGNHVPGVECDFSASLIQSASLFNFQYGYVEFRAKWEWTQGAFPQYWLLPSTGEWPPEFDIFEYNLGDKRGLTSTVHFDDPNSSKKGMDATAITFPDVGDGQYHTFGLEWNEDWQITYIDGFEVIRRPNIFFEPMFFVVNVGVGGLAARPHNAGPGWKADVILDSLKVWQGPDERTPA